MGALTVADITKRVQRQFGDEDFAQIQQSDVINWVNDAMREIANQNDLLQKQGTASTVANQTQYTLPTDILNLHRVAYLGFALRPISVEEADELITGNSQSITQGYPTGTPSHYWIFAGKINLFPAPDTAVTSGLILNYTRQPAPVTSTTDTPELPAQYDNRIVEYCLGQAFELDMNTTMMQVKNGQFQQGIDRIKGQADWASQEFYPNVTSFQEYPDDVVGSAY